MDIGHSSAEEKKKHGMKRTSTTRQWNKTADVMLDNFNFPRYQCVESRSPEEERWKIIHFTAESPNADLSLRSIHSANQLSIHGAVAICVKIWLS